MLELQQLVQIVRDGGMALVVVILSVGLTRQWYVPGWLYRDIVRDRDEWKAMALKGAHLAERALEAPSPAQGPR